MEVKFYCIRPYIHISGLPAEVIALLGLTPASFPAKKLDVMGLNILITAHVLTVLLQNFSSEVALYKACLFTYY